jgi:hypothetical protein
LQDEAGWKGKDNLMKTNTTLIICPASLMAQWENEIKAKVSTGMLSLSAVLWIRISIRIRIGSGFNKVPGSVFGSGLRIRIQECKNGLQKYKKVNKFHFISAGCSILRAEGFSCSLNVLYGGLWNVDEKIVF